jgi:hypothetical protein
MKFIPRLLIPLLALALASTADRASAQPQAAPSAEPPAANPAAPAPAPIPLNRIYLASLTLVRYNPLGLEIQNRLVFQHRLQDSESLLRRDTFASVAASLKLNPSYLKVGPIVELQPFTVLNVRAGYEVLEYFGSQGNLRSYPDATRDYSDDARKLTKAEAYSTSGHHLYVEPMVQARVGSIAVRSKLAIEYWSMSLQGGDRVFYDATLDTLVPGQGWVVANDTDLLYMAGRLVVGARFSGVWPRYDKDELGGGGEPVGFGGNSHMRLGPIAAFSFTTREYSSFNKPTLLAIAGWYLDHRSREGALPYLLLGFSFSSDFLAPNQGAAPHAASWKVPRSLTSQ